MPMETLLTFAIILGVPLWLAAEEILHRFSDDRRESKAVEPTVTAGPTRREARQPMETSSHVA
jgi:hypothetical protein